MFPRSYPLKMMGIVIVLILIVKLLVDTSYTHCDNPLQHGQTGFQHPFHHGLDTHDDSVITNDQDKDTNVISRVEHMINSSYWKPESQLKENMVPPDVYYFWCARRWFEFKHYLSVLSVIKAVRPDKIYFYYEDEPPIMDGQFYNQWFDELKHDFQFLEITKMPASIGTKICKGIREEKIATIMSKLNAQGGIYVSENTWMLELSPDQRTAHLDFGLSGETIDGYIIMKAGVANGIEGYRHLLNDKSLVTRQSTCSAMRHVMLGAKAQCVHAAGLMMDSLKPMHIWDRDDPLGKMARMIFYGTENILKPVPSYDTLVPNIGHMVWIGGGRMDYVFYLSLLSMLFVAKVDVVYIHGDKPPSGPNWAELNSMPRIRERIKLIRRNPPTMVYQGEIQPWFRSLMSDIIRVDLMIKYGGVYTDTDAIWVKPITYEDRGYDAVATYDWIDWANPYPDIVNFGISYGKRNAPFWRLFRETMRVLHNDHPGHTGVHQPYKILEKHPELLRIDKRLGVICYQLKCHPLWVPDYHNQSNNHVTTGSIKNWKEDVHVFHWTHPNPPEYANKTTLLASEGLFADLGRYVLEKAGLL